MKVDVYDTYATSKTGKTIHFDVLLASPSEAGTAYEYAVQWLSELKEGGAELYQSRCNFCHSENASEPVIADIESKGFHILQMEGCPNPV
ncbi:MAG: DUF2024 family protein [Planctomycetota bacterium]